MVGVFVRFSYPEGFDPQALQSIADTARTRFEGMPGLRSKAFTFDPATREATNFYVWDARTAAEGFFSEEIVERIAGLYGVRPAIQFVQIAALVENARA